MTNKEIREKVELIAIKINNRVKRYDTDEKVIKEGVDQIMQIVEESVKKERERIKLCAKEQSCSMCMEWLSSLKKV